MSEDWSLKEKKFGVDCDAENIEAYYTEDIEKLRQKLIEDLDQMHNTFPPSFRDNIKMAINKRFGVE